MGIEYKVKPEMVRGLDYYTRTAFEIISEDLGAQNAVGGGGRYDDLVELLGGTPTPAIGFGTGLERILMLMKNRKAEIPEGGKLTAYVAAWEDEGRKAARGLLGSLRRAGIAADTDYSMSSLKSQLRRANKLAVPFVILVGKDEVKRGKARLKSMATGKEVEVELGGVFQVIRDGRF
jgi:histidyl-tRNA synthetase